MNSANKGEWSELYALGYLLFHGGGFAADELAKRDNDIFYKVLEVVDNPTGNFETIYTLHGSEIEISQNGIGVIRLDKNLLEPGLKSFFENLVSHSGSSAFGLRSGEELMNLLLKSKLSASASLSADIQLVVEDYETKLPSPRRGFSIKSEIGNPATIFNASGQTNLTYRIVGEGNPTPFSNVSGVKANLESLYNQGFRLEFMEFDSATLNQSLLNIDSKLPEFLAELMLAYYTSKTTKLRNLCFSIWPETETDSGLKISKIKKFLSAASMGLRSSKLWSGYPQDFGGLLLVKMDGDVLFYYLYNLKKFEEYLFSQLRFETPSATKHKFGQVYFVSGEPRIKLNLQVRY